MLTDPMPAEAVEIAHKQILLAAEDLDGYAVASLLLEAAGAWGVPALWEQVCRPLLARLPGRTASEIVVVHALCEGVRSGLTRTAGSRAGRCPPAGAAGRRRPRGARPRPARARRRAARAGRAVSTSVPRCPGPR
ncbi:hypothetical protein NKG94_18555 [Micromonospora sp. M12]